MSNLIRTCITIPVELRKRLRGTSLNWSEIANAALWRAVRRESLEDENSRLRCRLEWLESRLKQIEKLARGD